jgi:hypothetical protein
MRTAELLEQLSAAKSLPPGCFGVSGNVAKEAAALIERYEEALTQIEQMTARADISDGGQVIFVRRIARQALSKAHHTGRGG